jgi:hypothetical protein
MKERELIAALRSSIKSTNGGYDSKVSYDRAKALDYYFGEPLGNEVEGRSQVVTSEVSDTIEWILPQLLKMFATTTEVVRFDPVGPEDEAQADQETDYINHIFYKENDGFDILYTWFKDALLSKNGIVKYYYDETVDRASESYEGLTPDEFMMLVQPEEIEVKEYTESEDGLIDVTIERTDRKGKINIEPVPPEEFLIDSDFSGQNLSTCEFCAHQTVKTMSQLRQAGYDKKKIETLNSYYDDENLLEPEYQSRFNDVTSSLGIQDDEESDKSMRKVQITECIKRVDYNGDGIAELRKITLANETVVLENEEIGYVPFETITPIKVPHRFFGRSIADMVMDLQEIKSTLLRNILDNLYLINNTRTAVVDGEVNLEDLLDSRPGGVVRMTAPGMANPLPTQPFTGQAFGMLEYLDTLRENRTGVTRYNQGMDANSLNKTATGIDKIMTASQERVHLIARIFGDGVKRLMLGLHRLALQNMDKEKIIRIRGDWVPVNPSEWKDRENMTVTVGLGTGDKDKQKANLMGILQIQKEAMAAGGQMFVEPKHILYTFKKYIEACGYQDVDQFFNDPNTVPWPPEQQGPSPEEMMIQVQMQIEQMKAQVQQQKTQIEAQLDARELELREREAQFNLALKQEKMNLDKEKAIVKAELDENKRRLAETEAALSAANDNEKLKLEKYKADLQAETQILLEKMRIQEKMQLDAKQAERVEMERQERLNTTPPEPVAPPPPPPPPKMPDVHIHQGGKKKFTVKKNEDGTLEGESEDVDA